MLEILFSCAQGVCVAAYVYGAYLVIKHVAGGHSLAAPTPRRPPPRADDDDGVLWQRYLAADV